MMGRRGIHAIDDSEQIEALKSPYPYFGGKRRVASLVWERFGRVDNYVEPFFGSGAVLLARPHAPGIETINDIDCDIANVWRAIQRDPDAVAKNADWPVMEADLHAMHLWLVQTKKARAERIRKDPDYYDPVAAGRWLYGIGIWIGGGWGQTPTNRRPLLTGSTPGVGVHRKSIYLGGGAGGGSGVHAPSLTKQQIPDLSGDSGATGRGVHASALEERGGIYQWMRDLCARMRRVRVISGDWSRVLTPSVTTYLGITGVFLDPPYKQDLRARCYAEDHDISADVRAWAIEHGDDPMFRIALCGYEDEHGPHMPDTWDKVAWKAHGGYSRTERGRKNRDQERIWFSQHCLAGELPLFAEASA